MKVLLLDLGTIMRGGQRQVFYLARHLKQVSGCSPLVAVPQKAPLISLLEEAEIPFVTLPSASDYNPLNTLKVRSLIKSFKPDIVHTHDAKGASLAAVARKISGTFKLVHSRLVSYRLKPGWSKKKYLYGDAIVAVSREIKSVLESCGIPDTAISIIHSGIDSSMYPTESKKHPVLTIGALGTLSVQKGFEVLIEALAYLKEDTSMPAWQCMIAGDGPLRKELTQLAEELDLSGSILFLGYRDSRMILPEMDILTIPSIDGEGSNAVIKEGWTTQIPVIASDLPSNLELVAHDHNGLVFPNKDAHKLATAISRIAKDRELAHKLVQNGSTAVKNYSDTIMAEHYVELYEALLSHRL